MALMIARVLREEGYAVQSAGDGRLGRSRAVSDPFDLTILGAVRCGDLGGAAGP